MTRGKAVILPPTLGSQPFTEERFRAVRFGLPGTPGAGPNGRQIRWAARDPLGHPANSPGGQVTLPPESIRNQAWLAPYRTDKPTRVRFAITDVQKSKWYLNLYAPMKLSGAFTGGASLEGEAIDSVTGVQLAERVPVEEYSYIFKIKSDFGDIVARGRDMLDLRLRELNSIESAKKLSKDPHAVDGVLDPLKDTGKGLVLVVTEPLESLKRAPRGFTRMVNQYVDPADRRAGSPERRKLATELDCDPETDNPILKKLLDDMAVQQFGGSLITRAAISFVPGLSVLPTTAEIKDTSANSPPSVINDEIDKELESAGVEKSIRSRFCRSTAFTTMQRLQLMEQFKTLEAAGDRTALLEGAAEARTQAEALGAIREGKMLVDIQKSKPILRLEFVGLPSAVLGDGTHVVVCAYDYVNDTQELADGVSAYRASNPNVITAFVSADRVSPAARKTLESANITVVE